MISARHIPMADTIMINAKGNALMTDPACKALSPLANSKAMATSPDIDAQKTRCHTGVCAAPPDANESITSEPESEERSEERRVGKAAGTARTSDAGDKHRTAT